jgi:hypothetical protein
MKEIFANHHRQQQDRADDDGQHWNEKMRDLEHQLDVMNEQIQANRPTKGVRWLDPGLLPPLHPGQTNPKLTLTDKEVRRRGPHRHEFFDVPRRSEGGVMAWETEYVARKKEVRRNHVDYTRRPYRYPELTMVPPTNGEYPKLRPLQDLLREWPQDELDSPPDTIQETLMHFDYNIPEHMVAAKAYRDAKLPFKLINVPEVVAAGQKWTDDYVSTNFDGGYETSNGPPAHGTCQESVDNFFAFFVPTQWSVSKMGIPPTRNNDWTFAQWAKHAHYADHVGLPPSKPHFYWQAGVDMEESQNDPKEWCFISRDLPSFSSPTETFFVFEPEEQKGIQCRFGERGVTAATHYDSGRNMIAMMTGAKRYILSPPKECSKLGIINNHGRAIKRHSMLNFEHLNLMEAHAHDMPKHEQDWLARAGTAESLSTVLKAGEGLYIPSFWFHYIISLQKSAQCNVRSGIDTEGENYFGSEHDVKNCDAF